VSTRKRKKNTNISKGEIVAIVRDGIAEIDSITVRSRSMTEVGAGISTKKRKKTRIRKEIGHTKGTGITTDSSFIKVLF